MTSFLFYAVAFVVALGLLITVHEFGHYWVARTVGVKVLRFSIGFGRPLWKRVHGADRTEFVLAAIPLGGYVKMLDEREGDVAPAEQARAFNRQPVGKRIAVVVAGPLFNLLFAIFAYWAMYVSGVPGTKPIVDPEPNGLAARAGVEARDLLRSVDGVATPTVDAALLQLLESALNHRELVLEVERIDGALKTVTIDLAPVEGLLDQGSLLEKLGLQLWRPVLEPVIGGIISDKAAERAGLQEGDRVLRANGQAIATWPAWVEFIQAHPNQRIELQIERQSSLLELAIIPDAEELDGRQIGRIGAYPFMPAELQDMLNTETRYGPLEALARGLTKTWDMSVLMLRTLWKMVVGEASLKNISGPLTIAEYAGHSASLGLVFFLNFLAIVSISLGVLNLLPIPVLDGGHLMYYLIELFKGSPVSEQTEILGQKVGLAILFALMSLALFNDFTRLLG